MFPPPLPKRRHQTSTARTTKRIPATKSKAATKSIIATKKIKETIATKRIIATKRSTATKIITATKMKTATKRITPPRCKQQEKVNVSIDCSTFRSLLASPHVIPTFYPVCPLFPAGLFLSSGQFFPFSPPSTSPVSNSLCVSGRTGRCTRRSERRWRGRCSCRC